MATAKEQLLSMMNPQQARLLDQQLRQQQVAQRAQGAGMLSGLVQAYTGMGDIAQRVGGIAPMGVNEMQAVREQQKKKQEAEMLQDITATTESERYRKMAEAYSNPNNPAYNIATANIYRQKAVEAKRQELTIQKEQMTIEALEVAKEEKANIGKAANKLIPTLEDVSEDEKSFMMSLPPELRYTSVKEKLKLQQKRKKVASAMSKVDVILSPIDNIEVTAANSTTMNNRYQKAINFLESQGLTAEADSLRKEAKSRVDQKTKIEDRERSTKKDWTSDPVNRASVEAIDAASKSLKLLQEGDGGYADIAVLTNFMKSLDPSSVVRETEFDMAAGVGGAFTKAQSMLSKFSKGERLTPEQRKQLADTITILHNHAADSYNSRREDQVGLYKRRGLDTDFVFGAELPKLTSSSIPKNDGSIDEEGGVVTPKDYGTDFYNLYNNTPPRTAK